MARGIGLVSDGLCVKLELKPCKISVASLIKYVYPRSQLPKLLICS